MMTGVNEAAIISAVRTPIGRAGGALAPVPAWDLAVAATREAIRRAGIDPAAFDDVVLGETVGGGGNAARYVGLATGVPRDVPGMTVVRACASGMEAVIQGATGIWAGVGDAYLVGGCESMSQQPWLMRRPDQAYRRKPPEFFIPLTHPTELAPFSVGLNVGESAASIYGVTREDQDRWALQSHERAVRAIDEGRFTREIVPVDVMSKRGTTTIDTDEHPRRDTSLEKLAKLPPAYVEGGTVTAGNASGINDGGAALVVTSLASAQSMGLKPRALIRGWASAGVDPGNTGSGPIEAVPKALKRAGLAIDDVDLVEINEAFASQTVACVRELGLAPERVNVNGGAIALGHPVGATGARLVVTLLHELERTGGRTGVATLCAGGGMGTAIVIERVDA